LEGFLNKRLDYEAYAEDFAEALAEILMEILQESPQKDLAEEAKELAHQYARSQPDAVRGSDCVSGLPNWTRTRSWTG